MTECFPAGSIFHAQEDPTYCGAAAALTMLSDKDVGFAVKGLSERKLFDIGHGHNCEDWDGIDPTGLQFMLNDPGVARPSGGSSTKFVEKGPTSESEGTAQIVAALVGRQPVAPAALVHGGRHWVTINGIEVDSDPLAGPYKLFKLWVFDPEAHTFPGPSHGDNDDCLKLGVKDFIVTYKEGWGKMFDGAFWRDDDRFVSVSRGPAQSIRLPDYVRPPEVEIVLDDQGLMREDFIEPMWNAWVEALGGWPDCSPGAVLRDVKPKGSNKVSRLDGGDAWYLFRLERDTGPEEAGEIVATGVMNAQSGSLHSVKIYSPSSARRQAVERLRSELVGTELFWQPCLESFSPHLPFRRLEGGGFERLDKRRFGILTSDVKGM